MNFMFHAKPKLLIINNQVNITESIIQSFEDRFDIAAEPANENWFEPVLKHRPDIIFFDADSSSLEIPAISNRVANNSTTQDAHIVFYTQNPEADAPCTRQHSHQIGSPFSIDKFSVYVEESFTHFKDEKHSLENLTEFLNNAAVCVHCCDHAGRIIWANKTELNLLGYSADEYIGEPIANFHADKISIFDMLYRLANDETLSNFEARLKCKNGETKHVLINSNVYRINGEFMYTRCFTKDITEQKEVEEQLRVSEGNAILAHKNKLQFFSKASHELRTPMNAVLGYSRRLEKLFKKDQAPDLYVDAVTHISEGGLHLLELINDILDLARAEETGLELNTESLNFNEVAYETFNHLSTLADNKSLDYSFEEKVKNIIIEGDKKRIKQVISNLISNAIKYTLTGSIRIVVDQRPDNEMGEVAVLEVIDTGIGIEIRRINNLFISYSKITHEETKDVEGTGLGLAITEEIVRLHNGTIKVHSEIDKGSVFIVTLPTTLYSDAILSPIEKDAVGELFNIGMGQVGRALSEITGKEVQLNLPVLRFIPQCDIAKEFGFSLDANDLDVIVESFTGDISGKALLFFPKNIAQKLLEITLNTKSDYDYEDPLHQDAMKELGQIVINACFNSISNMLKCAANADLPYLLHGDYGQIFKLVYGDAPGNALMLLKMKFTIDDLQDIEGDLTFLMNLRSMLHFKKSVQIMLGDVL
ncbi:MAG: hypothetical protein COB51_00620 [Moraxellaceae bacterium]|nr:MAG: hypothetical protein COB51_00620 [Moraxellaceae bacterium]